MDPECSKFKDKQSRYVNLHDCVLGFACAAERFEVNSIRQRA